MDYSQFNPALPADHPFGNLVSGVSYWSASTEADMPERAWQVDFSRGDVNSRFKTKGDFVWCVRDGP